MKRIIDGKRYNTETAAKIAEWNNNRFGGDFGRLAETLYVTPKDNWFIQYDGGASTVYAVSCGQNSRCGSSGIKPVTKTEALKWLEAHHKTDAIEEYFTDQVEEA